MTIILANVYINKLPEIVKEYKNLWHIYLYNDNGVITTFMLEKHMFVNSEVLIGSISKDFTTIRMKESGLWDIVYDCTHWLHFN